MGDRSALKLKRYLPHAMAATVAVIVLPIGCVSLLVSGGLVDSMFVTGPVAMLFSLGASSAGSAWWKKRQASHDLVFSDLMIWGWLRRLRTERRISRAVDLLGNRVELPTEQQVEYFKELASALEARDPYTHGHTRRVTAHAVAIAERMGLSRAQIAKVRTAAAIHDIGKLNTPREVLNKPGRLSNEEFSLIKQHPVEGAEMAARLGDAEITAMVLHHHERLDGTGYPGHLAGENIPLGARIIAVADTFDAVTSKRPYRGASSHKKGIAILTKEAGAQLDPDAVRAFRSHYSGLRGIAVGSLLSSGPGQLLPWRWGLGQLAPLAKSVAALGVAGALGTTAASLAKPVDHRGLRPVRTADRTAVIARVASHSSGNAASKASQPRAGASTASRHHSARTRTGRSNQPASRHPGISAPATKPATAASGGHDGSSSSGPRSPSTGTGASPHGGGSGSGGGGSTGGGGSSSSGGSVTVSAGPVSASTSLPSVTTRGTSVSATTPSVTVSTPSTTVTTPVGPVKTPPVTVSTPSVTVSTPSVSLP